MSAEKVFSIQEQTHASHTMTASDIWKRLQSDQRATLVWGRYHIGWGTGLTNDGGRVVQYPPGVNIKSKGTHCVVYSVEDLQGVLDDLADIERQRT